MKSADDLSDEVVDTNAQLVKAGPSSGMRHSSFRWPASLDERRGRTRPAVEALRMRGDSDRRLPGDVEEVWASCQVKITKQVGLHWPWC